MLSYREATAFRTWIGVAGSWSEAAQGLVGAASTLATVSSDLAVLLERQARSGDRADLACQLRLLAEKVEDETADLRRHYLAMSADLEQYRSLRG